MPRLTHSPEEQARLDAQAEQQFGLPPGTIASLMQGNLAERYVRIAQLIQSGQTTAARLNQMFDAAGRHDLQMQLGNMPGGRDLTYTAGDYARMGAMAAAPLVGGLAYGAMAGGGAGAGAAGGAGAGGAGASGAAGAAGGGGWMAGNLPRLLASGASLLGGHVAGRQAQNAAEERAGGATLQNLLPLMMQLIERQQAQSGQNYGFQIQRHQANLPMQDALRNMAMGMLPRQYTQGLSMGTPVSQQPMPPFAPMPMPPRTPPEEDE